MNLREKILRQLERRDSHRLAARGEAGAVRGKSEGVEPFARRWQSLCVRPGRQPLSAFNLKTAAEKMADRLSYVDRLAVIEVDEELLTAILRSAPAEAASGAREYLEIQLGPNGVRPRRRRVAREVNQRRPETVPAVWTNETLARMVEDICEAQNSSPAQPRRRRALA